MAGRPMVLNRRGLPDECFPPADTNSLAGGGFGNSRAGCGTTSGGSVESRGDTSEPLLSSVCELAKLVVVLRLLEATMVPHRLPPQEAAELVRLRDEVSRLQTRCEDAERDLADEGQLRTAAEADSVRTTENFYTVHDANQDLRTENEVLVTRIREPDIAVAEQAHGIQRLKGRCRSSDAGCAAAMRYVSQERERMKAGLTVYNTELAKLRQYLEENGRGKVFSPSPRVKALLAENASLPRANSVLRQNSADHGLNTRADTVDGWAFCVWSRLGAPGPDDTGLLRLMSPSSSSLDSADGGSASPATETSLVSSTTPQASSTPTEGSAEHSFIRPLDEAPAMSSTESSRGGQSDDGLFDDPPSDVSTRKRRRLRQYASKQSSSSAPSKLPASRRLGRPSVDLKRKPAAVVATPKARSGPKKPRISNTSSVGTSPSPKSSHSPLGSDHDGSDVTDSMEIDLDAGSPVGKGSSLQPSAPDEETKSSGALDHSSADVAPLSQSPVEILDLTPGDAVEPSQKNASSPFSSPVLSYFPRKDGRPRRSSSVASELRMRESLEKELADDDFMLGLTAEDSVAGNMDSTQSQKGLHSPVSPTDAVAEDSIDSPAEDGHHSHTGEVSVVEVPVEAGAPVDEAPVPEPSPSVSRPGSDSGVAPSTPAHASGDVTSDEVPVAPVSSAPGSEVSANVTVVPARTRARSQRAAGISTQPTPVPRHGSGVGTQGGSQPRRQTHVVTATVMARRGTDTSAFAPAATVVSRAANSRKLTATTEQFLKPDFTAAWCQMLNVSLSESAPKDHMAPLDFAFLALMYNVHSSRHPWRVLFDRMTDEPLTFELGKLVQGVRISIRASGHGGLVQMWRRFSGHYYKDNEKIDLCIALRERRHWLQVSAVDNAIRKFKEGPDPLDPFTHVILGLWRHLNRMRNNRADLLRQQIDRLWEWCTSAGGRTSTLPTEVLLEPSYVQYSKEVLEWAPATKDWFRELRVLDANQPWRNCWIDAPAEHPCNTTYAPCNPGAPLFVPTSMTRQAVISDFVVDQSLADADLVAPWFNKVSAAAGATESSPAEAAKESSVGTENHPPGPAETAEALDEDSFSIAPVDTATSELDSAVTESSATPTGVEVLAHDAEEAPCDIVLAPFEMLVQIATSERLASE
ncbi:LOW QUALITY PROTEIN: hypothetical protein PHMEG_00011275 [Phytophthora megakarya]|uniref:Uncharacterized protein n=1 Tax=Phytophthora megakarya TaxID=4795 RepID=A0A225WBM6_9STRA|nr:LOW QUALITY PROTEIN: hypothetical protein PHMEG_00011275 [Phytophthora megakarya]